MKRTWNVWSGLQNCPNVFFSISTTKNKSPTQFLASQNEISIFGSHFRVFKNSMKSKKNESQFLLLLLLETHISMRIFFLVGPDRKFPVESDSGVKNFFDLRMREKLLKYAVIF